MTLSVFDAAEDSPRAEALVCEGQRLSFRALAERVHARCDELTVLGVVGETPVGLIADASLAMFETLYALFALGVPVVPLHPRLTAPERQTLLELAGARTSLDPSQATPSPPPVTTPWLHSQIPAERTLCLVATSGSTGAPKLAQLSRRAFSALASADAERVPPQSADRALLCLPLSHVGGLSVVIRSLFARRCCVVFQPRTGRLLDAVPELSELLVSERISLLSLVPPVLARLLRAAPDIAQRAPLRAVLLGGQACSEQLFGEARERAIPVLTSYGLTEACSQVSTLALSARAAAPVNKGVVGVGFPLPGVELRVVRGLLQVRGPTLFSGYARGSSPFDEDGFFGTGDRAELDPGRGLFVLGRASELVVSGGENIDPVEVEHALLACGGLSAAAVFGIPDNEFGARLAAAFEPEDPEDFDERALFAALDQRLARYKQPRAVCLFEVLPRLASGKLDLKEIRREAMARLRPADRPRRR